MSLAAGSSLLHYRLAEKIGAGGMGEVWSATDTTLGREVAIKILPPTFATDPERLARFEREAKVLASLNHPGIAGIYGLHESDGVRFLALELVHGEDLAERLRRGALAAPEALEVARRLAEALEYAHERGIIHRDLKPANIKLAPDGTAKVLDFGLARALEAEAGGMTSDLTKSPTVTQAMTHAGVILGTAGYMSPEQARGRQADRRADIWSFGAVLYEMLTGRQAFGGETISDTLAAVMRDEPDWSALPQKLDPRWIRLLRRCLAKDPRQRLQAIGEARIALEQGTEAVATVRPTTAARPSLALRLVPWGVTLAALAALWLVASRGEPPPNAATELAVVPAGGAKLGLDISYHPMAISPDGKLLAYTVREAGQLRMRLRRLDAREDVEIQGTGGARNLFFSPDSQWIGFFDSRKMYKVSVRGGTPVELADAMQDRLGTWLDDGTIVYSPEVTKPLYRIADSGGTPTELTTLDASERERTHRFPCALDGGPWIVFTSQTIENPGGYDDASIDAVSVATGERRHLFDGARRAVWAPGGYLILARGHDLYAAPIDPRDPRLTTTPVPVLAGVAGDASSGSSHFSIAGDGTLAWIPGGEPDTIRDIGWYDRSGRFTPTPVPPGPYLQQRLSPDGSRALVMVGPGGGASDLWLADLRSGGMNRLTHGNRGGPAVWLPDGVRFAYSRREPDGSEHVVVRRLDGAGGEQELVATTHPLWITDVTPDGRIVYSDYGLRDGQIHLAPIDGSTPVALPVDGEGYEQAGKVSPDGRWIAYLSLKTRREEVYVRRLDGHGGSWQLSSTGEAGGVRWGRDGRELFFVRSDTLIRVPLEVRGEELIVGQSEELFEVPHSPVENSFRDYDYDPIGDRFLFTRPPRGAGDWREIAVSLGWAGRLAERVR